MDFKCLIILTICGVALGTVIPKTIEEDHLKKLESSFPSTYSEDALSPTAGASATPSSTDEVTRDKRHLFKKWKKGGSETVVIRQQPAYQQREQVAVYERPGREVHHHHHYSYEQQRQQQYQYQPAPTYNYVESKPQPPKQYHHYQGYHSGYGSQSQGGYYEAGNGNAYGSWSRPPPPPPQQYGPNGAYPVAHGHNAVDRGQGAAAVNNIAIINARSGQTTNNGN